MHELNCRECSGPSGPAIACNTSSSPALPDACTLPRNAAIRTCSVSAGPPSCSKAASAAERSLELSMRVAQRSKPSTAAACRSPVEFWAAERNPLSASVPPMRPKALAAAFASATSVPLRKGTSSGVAAGSSRIPSELIIPTRKSPCVLANPSIRARSACSSCIGSKA